MITGITLSFMLFVGVYLGVTLWLSRGLQSSCSSSKRAFLGTVSIIVAARNEEETLPVLLASLKKQTFDVNRLEIIVVNDRSTDTTAQVLSLWQERIPHLQIITLTTTDTSLAPKKYALSKAIEQSRGDIILTTDADCEVGERWVEDMVHYFSQESVGLVQGITLYRKEPSTLLWLFQSLDFFSHSVVAAAGIGRNLPINSNANNFAYRRSLYEKLQGYGEMGSVISGDDDLFLQRVWEEGTYSICFSKESTTPVVTNPVHRWSELLEQRKRWGSKTMYYKTKQKLILSQIFLFYLLTLVVFILSSSAVLPWWMPLYYMGSKIVGELFFLLPAQKVWKPPFSILHAFWGSFLQLAIVIYAVFWGVFGTFEWKGETFRRSR